MQNKKQNQNQNQSIHHEPVLLDAVVDILSPNSGERYLDLTAGYGGHASVIMERIGSEGDATLVDRDEYATEALSERFGSSANIIKGDYASVLSGIDGKFDMILADLGMSSPQLDNSNRGFSFRSSASLDMRMDSTQDLTADMIVNSYSEVDLADLIYHFGEERQSRPIARAIVDSRPIRDTKRLAEIIKKAYRGRSRIHPATRTFQALRIAVNDELGQLKSALPRIEDKLAPAGRVAIISFHSLEDRIVKQFFRSSALLTPINKKVLQGKIEDVSNPRARSAKLRGAIKNTNGHRSTKTGGTKTNRR